MSQSHKNTKGFFQLLAADLPVDPPRPFLRLDVDIIVIDINLGNLNLEVVGKEPDGFPHRAKAGTPWRLKQRRRGRRAWRKQRQVLLDCNDIINYNSNQ